MKKEEIEQLIVDRAMLANDVAKSEKALLAFEVLVTLAKDFNLEEIFQYAYGAGAVHGIEIGVAMQKEHMQNRENILH